MPVPAVSESGFEAVHPPAITSTLKTNEPTLVTFLVRARSDLIVSLIAVDNAISRKATQLLPTRPTLSPQRFRSL